MSIHDEGSSFARDGPALEPVPISALAQYSYCPRRCALIHVEQTFDENLYTLRGRLFHERVHEVGEEVHEKLRIERGVPLWSERLGLIGKADVIEYHYGPSGEEIPYPVEYKVGPRKDEPHAPVQLCAQAMCLEEMTGKRVPRGAVYYHRSRRRREVVFDKALRARVRATTEAVRDLLIRRVVPPPANDDRCRHCSLRESCLPRAAGEPERLAALQAAVYDDAEEEP